MQLNKRIGLITFDVSKRCCYGQNCVAMDLQHKEKNIKK